MSCIVPRSLLDFSSGSVQLEQDPKNKILKRERGRVCEPCLLLPLERSICEMGNKSFILTFKHYVWMGKKWLLGIWRSGIIKKKKVRI